MDLITTEPKTCINTTAIHRGDCIRARLINDLWYNGFVTSVTEHKLIMLTLATVTANTGGTAYIVISAEDLAAGQWEIKWSSTLETIHVYPPPQPDDGYIVDLPATHHRDT